MRGVVLVLVATGCLSTPSRPAVGDAQSTPADAASTDGTSGQWSFTRTSAHTTQGAGAASPNTLQVQVAAGDLLVILSDGNSPTSGQVSLTVMPAGIVTLAPGFENDQLIPDNTSATVSSSTAGTWGVVGSAAGTSTLLTITATSFTMWNDLSATVFSGGQAAPQLVDIKHTSGGMGTVVSCGPISTAQDGVAVYVALRWTCADAPLAGPFSQTGTLAGNPYGMYAPTNGSSASATLTDCGSQGGWICSTLSLSP